MTATLRPTGFVMRLFRATPKPVDPASADARSLRALFTNRARDAKRLLKGALALEARTATRVKLASIYVLLNQPSKAQRLLQDLAPSEKAAAREVASFLLFAVQSNFGMAKLLLDHGACAEGVGRVELRPLARALAHDQADIALLLLQRGAKGEAFCSDVALFGKLERAGRTELARALLVQASDEVRQNLLRSQLSEGNFYTAGILLSLGASIERTEAMGDDWRRQLAEKLRLPAESTPQRLAEALRRREQLRMSTLVQLRVLSGAQERSILASARATRALIARAKRLGYDERQVQQLRDYLKDKAPLTINFPSERAKSLAANLMYQNQFATYTSRGALSYGVGGSRDRWERLLFGEEVYTRGSIVASDRPCYGSVNAVKARRGVPTYGTAMLVLDSALRDRVTLTPGDSSRAATKQLGLLRHAVDHVLLAYHQDSFELAMAASQGDRQQRPATPSSYLEMQVHAPLRLGAGVVRKMVLVRSLDYGENATHLRELATLANARFTWHGVTCASAQNRSESLDKADKHGWEVQAWTYTDRQDYLAYAKFDPRAGMAHQLIEAPIAARHATLAMLGDTGLQAVGFSTHSKKGTDVFMAKAPKAGTTTQIQYQVSTGPSPLALAEAHQADAFTLRGVAPAPERGQWQVLLGRSAQQARPVVHGMVVSKCAGSLEQCFDNAHSHGKQHGAVAALVPRDSSLNEVEVYYFNAAQSTLGDGP